MGNLSLGFIPLIFSIGGALIILLVLCITTMGTVLIYREHFLDYEPKA
jgi:hypothetical protein